MNQYNDPKKMLQDRNQPGMSYNDPIMQQRRELLRASAPLVQQQQINAQNRADQIMQMRMSGATEMAGQAATAARVAQRSGLDQMQAIQPYQQAASQGFTSIPQLQQYQDRRAMNQAQTGLVQQRAALLGAQAGDIPAARATANEAIASGERSGKYAVDASVKREGIRGKTQRDVAKINADAQRFSAQLGFDANMLSIESQERIATMKNDSNFNLAMKKLEQDERFGQADADTKAKMVEATIAKMESDANVASAAVAAPIAQSIATATGDVRPMQDIYGTLVQQPDGTRTQGVDPQSDQAATVAAELRKAEQAVESMNMPGIRITGNDIDSAMSSIIGSAGILGDAELQSSARQVNAMPDGPEKRAAITALLKELKQLAKSQGITGVDRSLGSRVFDFVKQATITPAIGNVRF